MDKGPCFALKIVKERNFETKDAPPGWLACTRALIANDNFTARFFAAFFVLLGAEHAPLGVAAHMFWSYGKTAA